MATTTTARTGRGGEVPTPSRALQKSGTWARRAPLLPALVFIIVMTQVPFLATLVISFINWNAYYPDERGFAGFDNFARVFTDTNTRSAVLVTILLTVSVVVVSLVLGLAIALLLDRKFAGRGAVRTLMITPFLVVPVAAALLSAYRAGQIDHAIVRSFGPLTGPRGSVNLFFPSPEVVFSDTDPTHALLRFSGWGTMGLRLLPVGPGESRTVACTSQSAPP